MSRAEAARYLGTTRSTVAKLEKSGKLIGCKPGSYCLVSVASIKAYLAGVQQIKDEALAKVK